uniref:Uncharacterized protein n=1 Tax=Providencia stuartii TaxID=588 RepID=A0AAI9GJ76_PROST|nr:hypothetical protein [Providencia stuartii]
MKDIIFAISTLGFLAFIIGLVKPKLVFMPNRKASSLIYLAIFLGAAVLGSKLYPSQNTTAETTNQDEPQQSQPKEKPFKYAELTLKEYKNETQKEREKIVNNYLEHKQLPLSNKPLFYSCISQLSYTKAPELKLNETLGWCYADFSRDPNSLNDRVNLDVFVSNFSKWDGSYRPLEKLIKNNMNDDDSYKHDETTFRLMLDAKPPYAIVSTTFRGKNAYGAMVKNNMKVKVDIATGDILEVIPQ